MHGLRRSALVGCTLLLSVTIAIGATACGDGGGSDDDGSITTPQAAAGQVVFNQTCAGCHAQDGIGEGADAPNLSDAGLSASEIRRRVADGDGHPGGLVSGDELEAVIAYVESIQ